MSRLFNVYRITNLVNYKLYFGFTHKTIKARWREHTADSKRGSTQILHNAIRKWGRDTFSISLESSWPTEQEAKNEEIRLIAYWQTNACRYVDGMGYNMTDGGEGASGYCWSEEAKQKHSAFFTGRTVSKEHATNISKSIKESWSKKKENPNFVFVPHNKGIPVPEDRKKMISDSIKANPYMPDHISHLSAINTGKKHGTERSEKIRKTREKKKEENGLPLTSQKTLDHIQVLKKVNTGKHRDEETKKKIGEAGKRTKEFMRLEMLKPEIWLL